MQKGIRREGRHRNRAGEGSSCHVVQGGQTFESVDEIFKFDHLNESIESY